MNPQHDRTELTLEALEAFIQTPAVLKPVVATALIDAAAVLAVFDPFSLKAFGPMPDSLRAIALEQLISASEPLPIIGGDGERWTLKLLERRAALHRLRTREAMLQALATNPADPASLQQRMFEKLVKGDSPALTNATRDEIAALITARKWLDGIVDNLPPVLTLQKALAKADVFAPLYRLVAGGFFGRVAERQQIRMYFENPAKVSSPLFVHGPGGIGKSTLLARSILDQHSVVCAYVDIDSPNVRPEMPLTFLLEILRQIRTQITSFDSVRLEALIGEDLSKREVGRYHESAVSYQGWDFHVATFGRLVADAGVARIAIAIDTFEEAQFLGNDVVEPALDLLFSLNEVIGALRIVISGRALPRAYLQRIAALSVAISPEQGEEDLIAALPDERRPIYLGDLADEDARALLQKAVGENGVEPLTLEETADVIGIVGRNPMSLRLAARILRDGGVVRLRENAGELLLQLKAEKIQAMLYGRILHHVHSEDVSKVAYPGLVVRRVTPEIVRMVLAKPCGLELTPARNEFAIWHDLSHEVALVQLDERDYSLRHRVDIRRVMLQDLLDHVSVSVVAEIDAAAVNYYAGQCGSAARAEEIYHRLRQSDPITVLEARWLPEASPYLKDALEDFTSAKPRLWLANKLGVTLEGDLRQLADLEEWEEQTARAVERYLANSNPQQALSLISERSKRSPRSPLYALEAETLRFLNRPDEALTVARRGVEAFSRVGATASVAELLLKMAVIEEGRQELKAARALLEEVQPIADLSNDPLLQLRALASWMRVDRKLDPGNNDVRNRLRERAATLLTDEVHYRLQRQPVLLRELAGELSSVDARLIGQAFQTLGIEVVTDSQLKLFADALTKLQNNATIEPLPDVKLIMESASLPDFDSKYLRRSVDALSPQSLGHVASGISSSDTETLKGFREYFRAGVDNILNTTTL